MDSIDLFFTYDYATLMNLGSLDINGLRQLGAYDDSCRLGTNGFVKITGLDGGTGV